MTGVIQGPDGPWSHSGSAGSFAEFLDSRGLAEREHVGIGLNPVVRAAWPILLLAADVRLSSEPRDAGELRRQVLDGIQTFVQRARTLGIPIDVIQSAQYVLCAMLDDAVLSTELAGRSHGAYQPLQAPLPDEPGGGEKFFEMVGRFSQKPERHLFLLELQYLCLTLGFAGRYRTLPRGREELREVQRELGQKIRKHHWKPPQAASSPDPVAGAVSYVPHALSWTIVTLALAFMALIFMVSSTRLSDAASPVFAALAQVGTEDFAASASQGLATTIKQHLAAEEARGELSIEEGDGQTRIVIPAADLFGSGNATLNPKYVDLLGRVATALNEVPGRILVVAHTDDGPVTSLRYRNNFELSAERAARVAQVLASSVAGQRIASSGAGSSQPRVPGTNPENRARNRRLEIIHISQ